MYKKLANNLAYIIIGLILATAAGVVYAYNVTVPQATQLGDLPTGKTSGNYQLQHPCTNGQILAASSTAATGWACVANTAALGATTTITSNILINGPSFTFATGTPDTNLGLNITGSGSTITFQPAWVGTLAAGRLNSNVVQTLATGTTGSIFNGSISAQTLTLNLPFASGSNTGQLQSADWTTFNNKVATSRQILTTSPITGGGDLSADRTIACATCLTTGSANAAWTIGSGVIYNATSTDEVGIGTSTPQQTLSIVGEGTDAILNVASSSGTSILNVASKSVVGIGTTTAPGLLTLQGSSSFSSDLFDIASSTGTNILSVASAPISSLTVGTSTTVQLGLIFGQGSTASTTLPLFTLATSTGSTMFQIDSFGHKITGGTAPTCGAGCSSVTGDDQSMRVVTGSAVTSVTVNFANTYTKTPVCIANEESSGTTVAEASSTPTTVVLDIASALTSKNIAVICQISTNFTQ